MIIDKDDLLLKVEHYKYYKKDEIIRIELNEVILGNDAKFIATPVNTLGGATKNTDLHIRRETKEKALEDLISALEKLSKQEILAE